MVNEEKNKNTDEKDIDEKIFGMKIYISSPNFRRLKHEKNPYIFGEYLGDGRKFTVYIGKNGIKIHPYSEKVFVDLVLSIRTPETGRYVFVDGNTKGFCVLVVNNGRVENFFVEMREATSNSNEFSAILFANQRFPGLPIFSDSSYAISKAKKLGINANKVRAHSGVFWNTICDLILKNASKK